MPCSDIEAGAHRTDEDALDTAEGKKDELLRLAREGAPKPCWTSRLGRSLASYTLPSQCGYDEPFSVQIRGLRPGWFTDQEGTGGKRGGLTANERLRRWLCMARHRWSKGELAANKIRQLLDLGVRPPQRRGESARRKKQEIVKLARSGEPKPVNPAPLRRAMYLYTQVGHRCYDQQFDEELRSVRPDWFVDDRTTEQRKKRFLQMARDGAARPIRQSRMGRILYRCVSTDERFARTIISVRPEWFKESMGAKKSQLLELARQGGKKPSKRTPIGGALRRYTLSVGGAYDREFDKEVRALRPEWFAERAEVANSAALLQLARSGGPIPRRGTALRNALYRRTCTSQSGYDREFDKKIRGLRPEWFGVDAHE
jgi:hypothetical protein